MVANVASFGRNGVHDYILVRASSIILASYLVFILAFIALNGPLTFENWYQLFNSITMKVYTLVTLIALLVHAWIGVWQVLTDYVKNIAIRGGLLFICVIAALSYLAAGIFILWSV